MNLRIFLCRLSLTLLLAVACRNVAAQQLPPNSDAAQPFGKGAGSSKLAQTGPRTSPFDPPKATDTTFVVDGAPGLDTGCTFRSGGPLVFNIPITRYVGETNSDGTLRDAAALVAAGLLSPKATLNMPAFDVDFGAAVPSPFQPERDRVLFNGEVLGFLTGENDIWKLNSFQIPIEKVQFPNRAAMGSTPTPAMNEIRIEIDVANTGELWCTSIDWGALSFKAMSPIILIHGNNSDGGFFDRRGFTDKLRSEKLLYDNSINLPTDTIRANGRQLNDLLPGIVKSFGVDSVHLVVHSKGGLDSREYLATYQPSHDNEFTMLSYTSLSTPHNGSVLAELQVKRTIAANTSSRTQFVGFPSFTDTVSSLAGLDIGTTNLTPTFVAGFNTRNVSLLPPTTVFNTVAADADRNGNGQMDRNPDEYAELRAESSALTRLDSFSQTLSRRAVDIPYQILRNTASITLTYRTERTLLGGTRTVAVLSSVPNPSPLGNDVLVTIPNGRGEGSIASRTRNSATFDGANGRNHSSVADGGVAATVIAWIKQVERNRGDLK